jgi:DNA helicase-2/ATP-dependent DNA helicase PcrA
MATLRPHQQAVIAYQGGRMGVSAVPGSGKTWTLSYLAADIIASTVLDDDQEVLIVTLVNSAVDNFYQRVGLFIQERGLLPNLGYRVRTLHGLAHDIVRERPSLVGLENNFQIIDERAADSIRDEIAQAWLHSHPDALDSFLEPDLDENRLAWVKREQLPELVKSLALSFIRYAKDQQLTPGTLLQALHASPLPLPLAEMGAEMYADYERALAYRGAVDFDDLIRLALAALEADPDYLQRLRYRWPFILEDEAQDSSRLQEKILALLSGPGGNWVRVGDPNQAIYETFTTADPKYLRAFIAQSGVQERQLPVSGRSSPSIIALANQLVHWTQAAHPVEEVRDALSGPPFIQPTEPDDPLPNPADDPGGIFLIDRKFSPQQELDAVADSLARWLPDHPQATVAVLVPRNQRAFEIADELRRRELVVVDDLLRSSLSTRRAAGALGNLLAYLSAPQSSKKLATVYKVWRREDRGDEDARRQIDRNAERLRKCQQVEDFLWPVSGQDWLLGLNLDERYTKDFEDLSAFREWVRLWQDAILLPVDQLVLMLAQELFSEPNELALSHKLALVLRQAGQLNPSWRLPELTEELAVIAKNERRFIGFSEDDSGFDPQRHRGKVVVATMHKAKGLEWDRVYLMSVNNYDFPSAQEGDRYIAEKWYLRDRLNLEEEALAQLDALLEHGEYDWYQEGRASRQARLDYVRERLRLLYVGITRARRELVVTWNSGRQGDAVPAAALVELNAFWEQWREAAGDPGEPGQDDRQGANR